VLRGCYEGTARVESIAAVVAHVSGVVAEVLDGVRVCARRARLGVGTPRQSHAGRRHVRHGRLGRRTGERRRLRRPVEHDRRVGRRADRQRGAARGRAGLADRLARVDGRVRQPQTCSRATITSTNAVVSREIVACNYCSVKPRHETVERNLETGRVVTAGDGDKLSHSRRATSFNRICQVAPICTPSNT